jgi:3-oxoacyl-[acyl-carrier-protein] synthase II
MPAIDVSREDGALSLRKFGADGLPRVHPMWLLKGLANNVLYFVSLKFNAQGMNNNISMGGIAGTMAIGEAFHTLQRGYIDMAICGGYDSALDLDRIEMFASSSLASGCADAPRASRPFDRRRDGFLRGEGAGFLVLETRDAAERRGAPIYGEILGYDAASSGTGGFGPHAAGFSRALAGALADAGIEAPDAILAHGLATQSSDAEETRGIRAALGASAGRIPVPAIKSMMGNAFAGSGAIEAAAALLAARDGLLPPTINLTDPDPVCDLDHAPGTEARAMDLRVVALNNANLSGAHAALVVGRAE